MEETSSRFHTLEGLEEDTNWTSQISKLKQQILNIRSPRNRRVVGSVH